MLVTIALVGLPAAAQKATPTNLTSDIPNVGTFNDTNLVNPWGIVRLPLAPGGSPTTDRDSPLSMTAQEILKSLVVMLPQWDGTPGGSPDGIVLTTRLISQISGNATHFLFATEDGTVQGWSSGTSTAIAVNNFPNAVYKGLALGSANGNNYLYVANFRGGTVDVFDKNFAPFSFGGSSFVDSTIPSGFAPFNVANVRRLAGSYLCETGFRQT